MTEPGVPDDGRDDDAGRRVAGAGGERPETGEEESDAESGMPGEVLELPCGERTDVHDLDMGLREFECDCGAIHAVVMDMHPLSRWVPESIVEVLSETVETADEFEEFTTAHVMASVTEEFPERTVSADVAEDGTVGYALVWVTDFDSRRLHEVVVELLVELMEHAVSHADDDDVVAAFEARMLEFDVEEFVDQYRDRRDFESEHDTPV